MLAALLGVHAVLARLMRKNPIPNIELLQEHYIIKFQINSNNDEAAYQFQTKKSLLNFDISTLSINHNFARSYGDILMIVVKLLTLNLSLRVSLLPH